MEETANTPVAMPGGETAHELFVSSMGLGQVAYIQSRAIWFDLKGNCWVRRGAAIRWLPDEGFELKVECRPDGYHVWRVSGIEYLAQGRVPTEDDLTVVGFYTSESK